MIESLLEAEKYMVLSSHRYLAESIIKSLLVWQENQKHLGDFFFQRNVFN